MIARRTLLASGAAMVAADAMAQTKPAVIAVVSVAQDNGEWVVRAVRARLREFDIVEGRHVAFVTTRPAQVAEVAPLAPAVFIATGPQAIRAALASRPDTPVIALTGEMIASGFAQSLARPGGRVTGVSFISEELNAKRLEILCELLPRPAEVMILADPTGDAYGIPEMEASAAALGVRLRLENAADPAGIDAVLRGARDRGVHGINVLASPVLNAHRRRLIALAQVERIPAIYQWVETAMDGGLMAYGPSLGQLYRLIGSMAARVLRGTPVGEIPIERPTQIELAINMRTAEAIGVTIPANLLARADELIE
jgi:putative tryptophan/tyrosine transport system substrate-binding protein